MNTFSSVRRGIASSVTLPRRLSLRRSFDEPASSLVKRIEREHKTSFVDAEEGNGYDESTPSSPQGGPILERLEDLLEETAIYAVGDDQKAATWKPPSLQLALEERKRALWRGGVESLATPLRAMGEMGIGVELYFFLMREMAKLFTVMTLLHLPVMLLNTRAFECASKVKASSCFGGATFSVTFFIPRISLGDGCPGGVKRILIGLPSASATHYEFHPSPKAIGMVYCVVQLLTAVSVFVFTRDMHRHVSERLNELQLQHAQVSQFSVLVTNLPPDTDEHELARHFHRRYDLSRPQVAYPIYGLDVKGTSILSGILGGAAVFALQIAIIAFLRAGGRAFTGANVIWAVLVAFLLAVLIGYGITLAAQQQQLGRPVSVPPLKDEHKDLRDRREKQLLGMLGAQKKRRLEKSGTAVTKAVRTGSRRAITSLICCRSRPPIAKASTIWMMRSPNPQPVQDVEHLKAVPGLNHQGKKNHLKFKGKWIADVALIRSNGELIRQYMNLRALWAQVQRSRASVRRWSEQYGPAPNMHRCRKALNRLELLVEKMKDAQRELSRSVDRKGIDETTGAFVTFEHEWSAYRCIQDYAHSRSSLLRTYFQPVNLRLHRRKVVNSSQKQLLLNHSAFGRKRPTVTSLQASENGTLPARLSRKGRIEASFSTMSLPITVKAAVSPDDVLWENLGVPGYVKNFRRLTTILLSGILLAFTSMVVRSKIVASASVTPPTERQCREAIAVHFGRYPTNSTCALIDTLYTNNSFSCPGRAQNFLGVSGVHYAEFESQPDCNGRCVRPTSPLLGAPNGSGPRETLARTSFASQTAPGRYAALRNLTLCDSPCHQSRGGSRRCDALACGVTSWLDAGKQCTDQGHKSTRFKRRSLVECYCDVQIREQERKTFKWEILLTRWAFSKIRNGLRMRWQAVCREYLRERIVLKWTDRLLIVVIVSVNSLLELIFSLFSKFERRNSVSSSLVNTSVKTFLLSFLNTAVLTPLYNMRCGNEDAWGRYGMSWFCKYVLLGEYSSFSRRWYSAVGATIIQTVFLSMLVNLGSRFYIVIVQDPLMSWIRIDSCVTQNQLNELLTPRRFDIEHRYSFAFTYTLCTLVYCSGLPVLIPMSAVYFWGSYLADRGLVLRRYKQPPSYDAKLPMLLLRILPIASVLHLIMSSLVLSNDNLVASGSIYEPQSTAAPWLLKYYVNLCRHFFGEAGARSLSRVCVAPLFTTAIVAIAHKVLSVLGDIYNPELVPIPFYFTVYRIKEHLKLWCTSCKQCFVCARPPTAKVAADAEPGSRKISPMNADERTRVASDAKCNVPGGIVRRPTAWRRQERNLRMGPLTTRPGFTEEYRCLAPARASELMDVILERKLLQTVDGACSAIASAGASLNLASIGKLAGFTESRRAQLKQAMLGRWRRRYHNAVRGMSKVRPDDNSQAAHTESSQLQQQKQQPENQNGESKGSLKWLKRRGITTRLLSLAKGGLARCFFFSSSERLQKPLSQPASGDSMSSGRSPRSPRRPAADEEAQRSTERWRGMPGKGTLAANRFKSQIISGILFAPSRWSEKNAQEAVDAGWRTVGRMPNVFGAEEGGRDGSSSTIGDDAAEAKVVESTNDNLLQLPSSPSKVKTLLASSRAAGIVELERVHIDGPRKGKVMRTWEIIVAERRLPSYDIMANPNYRMALEFLESVGTFRPKRELVKDIGIFKEQLVRLNDRVRRQSIERALSHKVQKMRIEHVKRREISRAVCEWLVQEVEYRATRDEARRSVVRARRTAALASVAKVEAEVRCIIEACVATVDRRALVATHRAAAESAAHRARASRNRLEAAAVLERCITFLELSALKADSIRESRQIAEVSSRREVAAVVDLCVSTVETRHAVDEAARLRKERDRVRRRLHRRSSMTPTDVECAEKAKEQLHELRLRAESSQQRVEILERALAESRSLAASYERVARMAEASAKSQLEFYSKQRNGRQIADDDLEVQAPPAQIKSPSETPREVLRAELRAIMEAQSSTERPASPQEKRRLENKATETECAEMSPRIEAAMKSAREAERVASAALDERDSASADSAEAKAMALEERDLAILQLREAERLMEAAYADTRAAEEEQQRAQLKAHEALAEAEAARAEADTATRDREAAVVEACESMRLVEAAASEAARLDSEREAAITALAAHSEADRLQIERVHALEVELKVVASNALNAQCERNEAQRDACVAQDAWRAAEAVATAATADLDRGRALAAAAMAGSMNAAVMTRTESCRAAAVASDRAQAAEARAREADAKLAALTQALGARKAEVDEQSQLRVRAERELVEQAQRSRVEHDQQLGHLREFADRARRRADEATRTAGSAEDELRRASRKLGQLQADRDAALRADAEMREKLNQTQTLLHAALNRLPTNDLNAVLASSSASSARLAVDAFPAKDSILATAPIRGGGGGNVLLKHPSHLSAALHGVADSDKVDRMLNPRALDSPLSPTGPNAADDIVLLPDQHRHISAEPINYDKQRRPSFSPAYDYEATSHAGYDGRLPARMTIRPFIEEKPHLHDSSGRQPSEPARLNAAGGIVILPQEQRTSNYDRQHRHISADLTTHDKQHHLKAYFSPPYDNQTTRHTEDYGSSPLRMTNRAFVEEEPRQDDSCRRRPNGPVARYPQQQSRF